MDHMRRQLIVHSIVWWVIKLLDLHICVMGIGLWIAHHSRDIEDYGLEDIEDTNAAIDLDTSMACSEAPSSNPREPMSRSRKKRRSQGDGLVEAIKQSGGNIEASIETLCTHIDKLAYEAEMMGRREKLGSELAKGEGLTQREYLRAHLKIAVNDRLMVAFYSMADDLKAVWIRDS